MNLFLQIGTKAVVLALISYSVAIITEQKKHKITDGVLWFITIGIILDITATTFMIFGSENSPFTPHGILGYSSLLVMLIDAMLLWRFRHRHGAGQIVKRGLHLYSRWAYLWWILAFITGGLMVILK